MSLPPPSLDSLAVITGASSGIGEEFARRLADRGYRVVLVARREDRLEALAAELGGAERAVAIGADLSVPADRDRLVERIDQLGGTVDVLVNNAGFGIYESFIESGRERELRQVRVDVEAVVDLMARYVPAMVERGRGAVINMSSSSAFLISPFNAGYAAAKAHVLFLSAAVNSEIKGSGVTVTAVCPGPVATEFQAVNEADVASKLPKALWVSAERVVRDSLKAAESGRSSVIPGGPHVKAALGVNRYVPSAILTPIVKQMMRK